MIETICIVLTAVFTGLTALIMHLEKIKRQTPDVKLRLDRAKDKPYYILSLFFTPADSDYEINTISVPGCLVSVSFSTAPFGAPPKINDPISWKDGEIVINKMIYSDVNSTVFNQQKKSEVTNPVISFLIKPKATKTSLTIKVKPRLIDRLLFRQVTIRKRLLETIGKLN